MRSFAIYFDNFHIFECLTCIITAFSLIDSYFIASIVYFEEKNITNPDIVWHDTQDSLLD